MIAAESFSAIRRRATSSHPLDAVLDRLRDRLGQLSFDSMAKLAHDAASPQEFEQRLAGHLGSSGLLLFQVIDHGWARHYGLERRMLRLILGNPGIAIGLLRHDASAGLFAPVELLLLEEAGERCSICWLQPSSVITREATGPLAQAAHALDAKIEALVAEAI